MCWNQLWWVNSLVSQSSSSSCMCCGGSALMRRGMRAEKYSSTFVKWKVKCWDLFLLHQGTSLTTSHTATQLSR